ncbi:hypothetical protein RhiJN_28894 [Ceratobasidium sp. AG-Ba]|nr:hypothetical protein RhiJN_28894 [Ceratobasidium sp. AG-Ba]
MQRLGPPHYHSGSSTICYCQFSSLPQHAYGHAPTRPYTTMGDPRDYAPPVRRVPKPKSKDKVTKEREMKFDEENHVWYFETKEAPGIKWLESVWHIADLPQAKDSDFLAMINEYYICGHVMDQPDQDRLPVIPGGMSRHWPFKRSPPPPPTERPLPPIPQPPPPRQEMAWIEPLYRHPTAPAYASGSAHPVSVRIPSGMPHPDGWRLHSTSPYVPQTIMSVQEHYPSPYPPPIPSGRPPPTALVAAPPPPESMFTGDDSDLSDSEYEYASSAGQGRGYIPPPSPRSRRRAERLKSKGYRVQDPYQNAERARSDSLSQPSTPSHTRHHSSESYPQRASSNQPYQYPTPSTTAFIPPSSYLPKQPEQKIEIHRLLQTKSTLGISRIPDLVFDLRYDPKHAFDRGEGGQAFERAPAFWPGQDFVRLVIRHPFNGRGGDWVEDIDEAKHMTVKDVITIISEMVHCHIDQTLDWDPLSETDRSFVYEAYMNRPCPDEDAAGKRLHLFCDKYMFGGLEQLSAKAKGATAEGPAFLVKLMKNSKHQRYERFTNFSVPRRRANRRPSQRSRTTYPTLAESVSERSGV